MAYCPKCGVEVEQAVKACPLCNCTIPKIPGKDSDPDYLKEPPLRFPRPDNMYPEKMIDFKRSTFFGITTMFILNVIGLLVIRIRSGNFISKIDSFVILLLIIFSIWFYLFIFFGFVSNKRVMIASLIINSLCFTLLIDLSDKVLEWFFPVLLPSVIFSSVILIITAIIIRYNKKKSINMLFVGAVALSACICGIDFILVRYLSKGQEMGLSKLAVFISAQIIISSLVLLFFYHRLPSKMFKKIKMKLHM